MASVLKSPAGCYILILLDICRVISSLGINISFFFSFFLLMKPLEQSQLIKDNLCLLSFHQAYLKTNPSSVTSTKDASSHGWNLNSRSIFLFFMRHLRKRFEIYPFSCWDVDMNIDTSLVRTNMEIRMATSRQLRKQTRPFMR